MNKVIYVILWLGLVFVGCNPISEDELSNYWWAYGKLSNDNTELEKSNDRKLKHQESIANREKELNVSKALQYNDSLFQISNDLDVKIKNEINVLDSIKNSFYHPKLDYSTELGDEIQWNTKSVQLLQQSLQRCKSLWPKGLPDSLQSLKFSVDYSTTMKESMKKIFTLIAIENIKYKLLYHQSLVTDYIISQEKIDHLVNIHFWIRPENRFVKQGDTFRAFIAPIPYLRIKSVQMKNYDVQVDENGVANFGMIKGEKRFEKLVEQLKRKEYSLTFEIAGKDSVLKNTSARVFYK